jgi:hypothetical protein
MHDDLSSCFRELIRDTLLYLKDPLCSKQPILTNAKCHLFFQRQDHAKIADVKQTASFTLPSKISLRQGPSDAAAGDEAIAIAHVKIATYSTHPPPTPVPSITTDNPKKSIHSPIKNTLQRIAPNLKLIDQIPSDKQAKLIANGWKEKILNAEVILLVCDSSANTLKFLKALAKAIDQHLAKVKILMAERLEQQGRWDLFLDKNSSRLIIASDEIQKLPNLMRFYKSVPTHDQFFLDKAPLLILSPSSIYESLEHKALLWKTLCQMLKK